MRRGLLFVAGVVAAACGAAHVQHGPGGDPPSAPTETASAHPVDEGEVAGPPPPKGPPPPSCPSKAPDAAVKAAGAGLVLQDGHAGAVGHSAAISDVALSRNGGVLASGGFDGVVRVWDATSGLLLRRVPTQSATFGISMSDGGDTLATYSPDGEALSIQVRDLVTGAPPKSFTPTGHVFSLSPDGRYLAIGLTGVWLHDTRSGSKIGQIDTGGGLLAQAIAFDAAGKRIAVALAGPTASELAVVEVPSLKLVRQWKHPAFSGMKDVPRDVELTSDAVIVRSMTGSVVIAPIKESAAAKTLPGSFAAMALSGRSLWVTDTSSSRTGAFDVGAGTWIASSAGAPIAAGKIAASRDGSTLVLVSSDPFAGSDMVIEDAPSRKPLRTIEGVSLGLSAVAVDPSGRQIATGSTLGVVSRWVMGSGRLDGVTSKERSEARSLSYDAAGGQLAVATHLKSIRVLEPSTGRVSRQWQAHEWVSFAQFLPGGAELVTTGWDGLVKTWNLRGPTPPGVRMPPLAPLPLAPPPGKDVGKVEWLIKTAALAPDGSFVALLGENGTKLPTGQFVPRGGFDAMLGVVSLRDGRVMWETPFPRIDPNRRRIGVTLDGKQVLVSTAELLKNAAGIEVFTPTLRVYDARSGALQSTLKPGTTGPLAMIGDTLAIGGNRTVLYRWSSRTELFRPTLADTRITAIAAHPRRGVFVMAGDGGGTTLVSEKTGKAEVFLVGSPDGEFVAATPDGTFASSLDGARRVGWSFASPLEGFAFDQFATRFRRPDLVVKRLAGEEAAAPAPVTRPPTLTIAKTPKSVGGRTLSVKVTASSVHRVDRIRAFSNGRSVADKLVCAREGTVDVEVPLTAGPNRVTVVAYDAEGFASHPRSVDVTSTAGAGAQPDLWAVAIGVSRYPKLAPEHQLDFADDDARSITGALAAFAGPGKPFGKLHASTLLDADVTPGSAEKAIAGLSRMKPDDLAIVFLAGHGLKVDPRNMVFLTSTATLTKEGARAGGLGWDRIEAALKGAKGRVVLLLDACHSGHVSTELIAPNEALAATLAADDRAGVFVFAASRGSQLSYEVSATSGAARGLELAWEGQQMPVGDRLATGHGLFTSALLDAFGGRAVDRDRSGAIEIGELVSFVTERVRSASNGKQTPWVVRREMFGDFLVAPAGR